jgi:hypothetical protein
MAIVDKTSLRRIDELCREAKTESDPAKIADHLKEIIQELHRLLDAVDQSLQSAMERDGRDESAAPPKRWVS